MNEKKKLRRLPKCILSFVLTLAMVITMMPMMSTEVKAATTLNEEEAQICADVDAVMDQLIYDGGDMTLEAYVNDGGSGNTFTNWMNVAISNSTSRSFDQNFDQTKNSWYIVSEATMKLTVNYQGTVVKSVEIVLPDFNMSMLFEAPAHTHDWKYTVGTGNNANKLTAKCEGDGDCNVTNGKTDGVSLTLTASSPNYSGSATGWCEATDIDIELDGKITWESTVGEAPTIHYTGTTAEGTAYSSDSKPTEDGSYTASIECDGQKAELNFNVGHVFDGQSYIVNAETNKHYQECKACGSHSDERNHDFSAQPYLADDDGNHYKVCSLCGAETVHEAHTGGTATCTKKAVCEVCEKEYGELAAHSYSSDWKSDKTNHWHECTVCTTAKKDSAAHADANKDGKCDVCGYNMHSHSGTKVAQVDATCTSYGVKAYYKCSCGKYYTDSACTKEITDLAAWKNGDGRIAKKDHTYDTKWSSDGTNHWHACTVCGAKKDSAAHTLKTTTTKATLTANGKKETKCSVCGKVTKTETIYMAKTIKLSATKYTYDGKAKKPTVTIKDSKGNAIASTNYTVTYPSGRKNVGKYTVKVTFKGNYSGSKNLTFTINPPKTSISKLTAGKKAFTVKWAKKTTQVTGYEIQYSTSSSFAKGNKTVKVTSAKTVSKTISKLTGGKKYYVRIRTYKTVGKTPYYSDWSAKKSVTTKK